VSECVFCRIVAGAIPSARVYETDRVLAILDVNPVTPGHALLLAKEHIGDLGDAPTEVLRCLADALPRVARGVVAATGAEGCNVLVNSGRAAGQLVPHLHVHIIPRRAGDGLHLEWSPGRYREGEIDAWRARIAQAVERL
jgi:histidine triad (HIT) family protein